MQGEQQHVMGFANTFSNVQDEDVAACGDSEGNFAGRVTFHFLSFDYHRPAVRFCRRRERSSSVVFAGPVRDRFGPPRYRDVFSRIHARLQSNDELYVRWFSDALHVCVFLCTVDVGARYGLGRPLGVYAPPEMWFRSVARSLPVLKTCTGVTRRRGLGAWRRGRGPRGVLSRGAKDDDSRYARAHAVAATLARA